MLQRSLYWLSGALTLALLCVVLLAEPAKAQSPDAVPVTLTEDETTYTLANGYLTARIDKQAGAVTSLKFRDLDLLEKGRGYWSNVGGGRMGNQRSSRIRIDPKTNTGERAEVATLATYDGQSGSLPVDQELCYTLGRGDRALYTAAVWHHRPGYPAFSVVEARFLTKLNPDVFDYMTIDKDRRRVMPTGADWDSGTQLNMKEVRRLTSGVHAGTAEHKYDYSAVIPDTPAFGWSSTKYKVGLWFINPSYEYFGGGPTKVELTGHLDVNPGGAPTLLNYWLGSHYGGTSLVVSEQEDWTKVIGPFLIYCNSTKGSQEDLWKDALAHAAQASREWPYAWFLHPEYPAASGRGTVSGQIVLRDPVAPRTRLRNLKVGLAAPDYPVPERDSFPPLADWQQDAKFYQFWTRAGNDGRFTLPHVRPGAYTLHAFADGVLGEYSKAEVAVRAGEKIDLGKLEWTPVRYGRPLWEIGVPDRTAREFRHGDHFWQWGLYFEYPKEFPNDVHYVVGKSDWRKDWNYCQPPRIEGKSVRPTIWTITFDMPQKAVRGQATLRLALCGSRQGCNISVGVNGQPVGETGPLPSTGVMHRDHIQGYWYEKCLPFDAALLKPGKNTITLTSSARDWPQGVLYDYLRLELDEAKNGTAR